MKFTFDHDLHIHTHLSTCSGEPEQTVENILEYAKRNNLSKICVTDHYWDENVPGASFWYQPQNFLHIKKSLPLPKADGIEFLFGCETDVDKNMTLGIPEERYDEFDFIIVPTTHMHMTGFTVDESVGPDCEKRAELWIKRLDAVLNSSLPFEKVGIAHLTTTLISPSSKEATINTLNLIPDSEMRRLFAKAEKLGCGIEINKDDLYFSDEEAEIFLRPFRIAKECGAKFYLGSDSHSPRAFLDSKERFERAINLLGLSESDKFVLKT